MTIPKLALTWEEAADACGYSVRTLKQAVYEGNLMARYANSKAVIRVEDLAQWLDELPAEPKAGGRPVSAVVDVETAPDNIPTPASAPHDLSRSELIPTPLFRKPEDVAPELGMTPTELRRYCRESGIHTRLSQNRIMLSQEDTGRLVVWVTERQAKGAEWWNEPETERDPFA